MIPPTLFFFYNINLYSLIPLPFYINFRINLSINISARNPPGIFDHNCIKAVDQFAESWCLYYVDSSILWTQKVSIYLSLHWFLSLAFCSFQLIDPVHVRFISNIFYALEGDCNGSKSILALSIKHLCSPLKIQEFVLTFPILQIEYHTRTSVQNLRF